MFFFGWLSKPGDSSPGAVLRVELHIGVPKGTIILIFTHVEMCMFCSALYRLYKVSEDSIKVLQHFYGLNVVSIQALASVS